MLRGSNCLSVSSMWTDLQGVLRPPRCSLELKQRDDEDEERCYDACFDTKRLESTILARPRNLIVGDLESSKGTSHVDESGYFARMAREGVVHVRIDCYRVHEIGALCNQPAHDYSS